MHLLKLTWLHRKALETPILPASVSGCNQCGLSERSRLKAALRVQLEKPECSKRLLPDTHLKVLRSNECKRTGACEIPGRMHQTRTLTWHARKAGMPSFWPPVPWILFFGYRALTLDGSKKSKKKPFTYSLSCSSSFHRTGQQKRCWFQ